MENVKQIAIDSAYEILKLPSGMLLYKDIVPIFEKAIDLAIAERDRNIIEMIDTGFDTSFNVGYRKMKEEVLTKLEQYYDDK